MSLFGNPPAGGSGGGGLFGSSTANKPSPFGSSTTPSGGGLFGSGTQQQQQGSTGGAAGGGGGGGGGGGLFGSSPAPSQPSGGGLFGSAQSTQNQPSGGGLFGSTQNNTQSQPSGGGLFGSTQNQPAAGGGGGGGLFGSSTTQTQPSGGGLFGSSLGQQQKPPGTGLFGGQQQQQQPQQQSSLFGGGGSLLGGQQQGQQQQPPPQQQQQPQLGQTQLGQSPQPGSGLWSPGRAVTGVHRTVPMQMQIIKDKWESTSISSPFRSYLYNSVGEEAAPFYQPGPEDDETKWEDALRQRPSPSYVPVLVRGFWELGKRAQRQKDFLTMMQGRLHEINDCLSELLSRHDLKISVKIADCRRKHIVLSKRCLALAAKTQVLRNRGYAMDDAEEELKKKLTALERSVFDPTLNGRGEEIWARMLAIREQSKRLQLEMDRAGGNTATQGDDELDENTMKTVKKILDDYNAQIHHLQKELQSIKTDYDEARRIQGLVDQ